MLLGAPAATLPEPYKAVTSLALSPDFRLALLAASNAPALVDPPWATPVVPDWYVMHIQSSQRCLLTRPTAAGRCSSRASLALSTEYASTT